MKEFGLIGRSLGHSFSAGYFAGKFEELGLSDHHYSNFELSSIEEFPALLVAHPNLVGLNVTLPYKQEILTYIDEIVPAALEVGAVNTIAIHRSDIGAAGVRIVGYNTDILGFELTLKPLLTPELSHNEAIVFGTGGASKAVCYVLAKAKIPFKLVSRNPSGEQISYTDLDDLNFQLPRIFINTTPLGMSPKVEMAPPVELSKFGQQHVIIDLIYNPAETLLLREARLRGAVTKNGLTMLHEQAEVAWNIWSSLSI